MEGVKRRAPSNTIELDSRFCQVLALSAMISPVLFDLCLFLSILNSHKKVKKYTKMGQDMVQSCIITTCVRVNPSGLATDIIKEIELS